MRRGKQGNLFLPSPPLCRLFTVTNQVVKPLDLQVNILHGITFGDAHCTAWLCRKLVLF